ncbi:MAG: ParB N-terminal domain-containing protein [Streptomycetaceae bacterium]|nr:ParB N-terminal domain-containing protein [Streptomycetaceae bacterium]
MTTTVDFPADVTESATSMIQLAEILHRSSKLRQRRFEMLPLRGPGSPHTETQARKPGEVTAPEELSDLISSISVIGLLEPVLAEEIPAEQGPPTLRLVTGERRLRAMRWGAQHLPDNPHFAALPAVLCPGPLTDEERHMWRFVENFAREPLRPGEQAAALLYQRCAVLVGKLLRAGKPVPAHVYAITDSVERFQALEKIRGTDTALAAPWSEVLSRLGLQLSERKAYELVRAFRELPRDLTQEMDEAAIRLNTRIRFAALRRGRSDAAAEIWASLKSAGRLHLLPSAVDVGLSAPDLSAAEVIDAAESRAEQANSNRRTALTRVPDVPASDVPASDDTGNGGPGTYPGADPPGRGELETAAPTGTRDSASAAAPDAPRPGTPPAPARTPVDAHVVRTALEGLRDLLAELRAGRSIPRYDHGSLRLIVRELEPHLADANALPAAESPEHEGAHAA